MSEDLKKIKKVVKIFLKTISFPIIIIVTIIVLVLAILAGSVYQIVLDNGSFVDGDWKYTLYGAFEYINEVAIEDDGSIKNEMTAEEVWNKLEENGSSVSDYLDNYEELKKLIDAQTVTQYPDLRDDPSKEIDWQNVPEDTIQGIIKFMRADASGNKKYMKYATPSDFQSYIDDYKNTGDLKAKENALTHFTLEKQNSQIDDDDESSTSYYVKVAVWEEEIETVKNVGKNTGKKDEDVKESEKRSYTITTTNINYQEMVKGYTLPFDLLWSFLVISSEKEFVFELAELAYNSEIEITIHDNVNKNINQRFEYYDKYIRIKTDAMATTNFTFKEGEPDKCPEEGQWEISLLEDSYTTTTTKTVITNTIDYAVTKANVWVVNYEKEYKLQTPPKMNKDEGEEQKLKDSTQGGAYKEDNKDNNGYIQILRNQAIYRINKHYGTDVTIGDTTVNYIRAQYYKDLKNVREKIDNTVETINYVSSPGKVEEKTDLEGKKGENFVTIINKPEHYNAKSNITSAAEWLFAMIKTNPHISDMLDLVKYLLYKANGKDYGVTEYDFEIFKEENFNKISGVKSGLSTYLRQFSHNGEAPQSADGKYYLMYGDGSGAPTIGNADLQWESNWEKFKESGKILENGKEKTVNNIADYINNKYFDGNPGKKFSDGEEGDKEIEKLQIYIEKELTDKVGDSTVIGKYNIVLSDTSGLKLSQQQLYALTAIAMNFGHLPKRPEGNEHTFKQVYLEGAANYEINSFEHNKYIWDNWWSYLGGMTPTGGRSALLEARDGAYETYVKGIFDLSESKGGAIFGRTCYVFYTQEQIARYDYAKDLPFTRISSNEKEIFTYEENTAFSAGSNEIAEYALQFVGEGHSKFTSYAISKGWIDSGADWCAMFVSYCYDNCGLIPNVLKEAYIGCTSEVNNLKDRNEFIDASTGYIPKPGDIIFFKKYQNGEIISYHTGIVTSSDGIKVYTVEGNTGTSSYSGNDYWKGSKVLEDSYFINANNIYGYFTPSK